MHLFYCTDILNGMAVLSSEESAHCLRVLRLVKGDKVQLTDGKGGIFEAVINDPDPRRCGLEIIRSEQENPQRNFNLHIAIAPTKSIDRFEWFIEKAVEIGIDVITPLLCERSERRVLKIDRLNKLVLSAMKQANIAFLPVLNGLTPFNKFIQAYHLSDNLFIAHCSESERHVFSDVIKSGKDLIILIGPEGDFSMDEISGALSGGYLPVSLGPNRLRTETAGIVACHTANIMQ